MRRSSRWYAAATAALVVSLAGVPSRPVHHPVPGGPRYAAVWRQNTDRPYPTALAASRRIWSRPLVCDPPGHYYSTHGYTLLGAALEAAGGTDVKNLVRTRLRYPARTGR